MNPGLSRKLELFAILLFLLTDSICGQITFLGATSGGVYSFGSEDLNPELLVDLRSLEGTLPNEILEVNGKFYGTTQSGGLYGRGAIFTIDADGSNYEVLFSFQDSNGRWPQGQLLYSHGALWGVTRFGGDKDDGAIYTIDLDGANFEVVHYFDESVNGAEPVTGLIKYQNQLLGLTSKGGPAFGLGTIFSIEVSTQSYELIHEFESGSVFFGTSWAALLELEGKIYGTTNREGANGYGEIFRLNPDGTGFTILHEFDLTTGGEPFGKLVYSNSKIWGTCSIGGEIGNGVIFNVELDGSNYTMVHSFNGDNGDRPIGSLAENDGFLWGTTLRGGLENLGTLFRIKIDGSDFEKVFDNDLLSGHTPSSIPLIYGDRIYIAINRGGKNNFGTIVSFHIAGTDYKKEFGFNQDLVASGISSSLIDCEGTLWGMTRYGGLHGKGILFNINRDESEFSIAHSFDGDNGGLDEGNRLFHLNNKVLGMTTNGVLYDMGVIFTINNDVGDKTRGAKWTSGQVGG
ncbi:MAG: choice-of-anchor tandem repeat GloVer-containing protein, partial [Ekhidna sp.]